jgi:hypothetical protein
MYSLIWDMTINVRAKKNIYFGRERERVPENKNIIFNDKKI